MSQLIAHILMYALCISFTIHFVLYSKYQFRDEDDGTSAYTENDKHWHRHGLFMRLIAFAMLVLWHFAPSPSFTHIMSSAIICAFLFDTGINLATKKPIFYHADHGLDKILGRFKWWLYPILFAINLIF